MNDTANASIHSEHKIGLSTATALAIANMVGIGVFTSLGFQVKDIASPFALMMLWVVGGMLALCGALCYAELATALPRSGGEYNFLSRIYGRPIGFMAGWISATVGFAAPAALAAMAFGSYLKGIVPAIPPAAAAILLIAAATLVHLRGARAASRFQDWATLLKIILILAFIVAGLFLASWQPISFAPRTGDLSALTSAPFAVSLIFVMYSYAGWNAAAYIAGEVKDPARTLPRSILMATLVVALLYVVLNAVFLLVAPAASYAGQIEVGLIAGNAIFGSVGGSVAGWVICLGLISSVSAMLWLGPRVAMAMGEDHCALALFAKRSEGGVPVTATLVQAAIALLLVLTGSFESVLEFIQFALTVSSLLAVAGVIVLRHREPELKRPFRVWAYPLPPLFFIAISLATLAHMIREQPKQSLASLAMLGAGLAVYALTTKRPG